jgi:hypothetical protein
MNAVRDQWTDDRLDDLNHRVDEGFKRNEREFQAVRLEMRTEFAAVRSEMKEEFVTVRAELGGLRQELSGEIGGLRGEFAALNRTLIQIGIGGLITLMAGVVGVILTQLL